MLSVQDWVVLQGALARQCVEAGRLKDACAVVKCFGLQAGFPTLERNYREHTLQRLMDKRLWAAATGIAGADAALQVWNWRRHGLYMPSRCGLTAAPLHLVSVLPDSVHGTF